MVSSLRIKIERERLEKLEAAAKGRAPKVVMPEQPAQFRNYDKQTAADDAIQPLRSGGNVRARVGQPRPVAPDPATVITMDVGYQRAAEAHKRQSMAAAASRIAAENAERERQRIAAAAEAERLRLASLEFENQTNQQEIREIIGSLTIADVAAVEALVRQQFGNTTDPSAWRLALGVFRDEARVRQLWDKTPLEVIENNSDVQLAARFETSVEVVQRLRAQEL